MSGQPYDWASDPDSGLDRLEAIDLTGRIARRQRQQIFDALVHDTVESASAAIKADDKELALAILVRASPKYERLKEEM